MMSAYAPVKRIRARSSVSKGPGFTLIEMIITVAILGILSIGVLPLVEVTMQRTKEHELRTALRQLREGIDAYKQASDEGRIAKRAGDSGYPRSLDILVEGVEDAKDPKKAKIYFLRRIPRDPMDSNSSIVAAETWGQRSYASPPDAPKAGDDVFDVYSLSPGTGLNGVRYREW
jgi:general secretion pathway protein G